MLMGKQNNVWVTKIKLDYQNYFIRQDILKGAKLTWTLNALCCILSGTPIYERMQLK